MDLVFKKMIALYDWAGKLHQKFSFTSRLGEVLFYDHALACR